MHDLEEIRAKIDEVDERMAELFAQRLELAREAAEVKRAQGLPAEDPEREQRILERGAAVFKKSAEVLDKTAGAHTHSNPEEQHRKETVDCEDYLRFQKTVLQISKDAQKR
ncbi:MAG: chorismate mutase [Bacteroidales bacterium]|nr:chorismate mutase [Bacteroidales bacterium]